MADAVEPGAPPGIERRIVGFHQDEEQHWVARLECGHDQHVRHEPPWRNRPWVVSPEGRAAHLGAVLRCLKCQARHPHAP